MGYRCVFQIGKLYCQVTESVGPVRKRKRKEKRRGEERRKKEKKKEKRWEEKRKKANVAEA